MMSKRFLRLGSRVIGGGLVAVAVVCLGLCGYCAYLVHSFWAGAQPLDASITNVWRLPIDDQRGTEGCRMAVTFADPSGTEQTVQMSGLYRAEAGDVGRHVTLYYNAAHPVSVAMDSPWHWAGAAAYGAAAVGLLLAGGCVIVLGRRWVPAVPLARASV